MNPDELAQHLAEAHGLNSVQDLTGFPRHLQELHHLDHRGRLRPATPGHEHDGDTVPMLRLLVCGSRTLRNTLAVHRALDKIAAPANKASGLRLHVIHGAAAGADRAAAQWVAMRQDAVPAGVDLRITGQSFPAWWGAGGMGGPSRNEHMLRVGRPDMVLAFTSGPLRASRGTLHMVALAREARLPVDVREQVDG